MNIVDFIVYLFNSQQLIDVTIPNIVHLTIGIKIVPVMVQLCLWKLFYHLGKKHKYKNRAIKLYPSAFD
jgi:hypothetical protein